MIHPRRKEINSLARSQTELYLATLDLYKIKVQVLRKT
jgi:hypothetical protein